MPLRLDPERVRTWPPRTLRETAARGGSCVRTSSKVVRGKQVSKGTREVKPTVYLEELKVPARHAGTVRLHRFFKQKARYKKMQKMTHQMRLIVGSALTMRLIVGSAWTMTPSRDSRKGVDDAIVGVGGLAVVCVQRARKGGRHAKVEICSWTGC